MKVCFLLILTLLVSNCFANETWQHHWEIGREHFAHLQHQEGAAELDRAINLMSLEEQEKYPYVLVDRAENNYYLQKYWEVLEDTGKGSLLF